MFEISSGLILVGILIILLSLVAVSQLAVWLGNDDHYPPMR